MSARRIASDEAVADREAERLFVLVNAPATATRTTSARRRLQACETRRSDLMRRCGLTLETDRGATARRRRNSRGCFRRRAERSTGRPRTAGGRRSPGRARGRALPGLYLAGGSVHPGPGVPMAALSGRLAAAAADGGPRFDAPVRPGGYAWWYVDALQRRRRVTG